MSSANLPACDQSEHVEPIRLVAWHIAEEFKTLPTEVFAYMMDLDDPDKWGQKDNRWWGDERTKYKQTTYLVSVAAHVGECLKWWSLSSSEKGEARELFKRGGIEECQKKFPFDTAFFYDEEEKEPSLPPKNGEIKELGRVITLPHNKALIVAYLAGLAAIYEDETRANRLSKLTALPRLDEKGVKKLSELAGEAAEKAKAAAKAEAAKKAKLDNDEWNSLRIKATEEEWSSFRAKAAEEVRCLLSLW